MRQRDLVVTVCMWGYECFLVGLYCQGELFSFEVFVSLLSKGMYLLVEGLIHYWVKVISVVTRQGMRGDFLVVNVTCILSDHWVGCFREGCYLLGRFRSSSTP